MKAVVIDGFGGPEVLRVAEVPMPDPGPGTVRVRVEAVAVARTKDVAARAGRPPFGPQIPSFPHILGTEHAGVIDSVGPDVDELLVGRRVAVSAALACGECRACRAQRDEACTSFRLIGVHRSGSYAEYTVVPAGNVSMIPDDIGVAEAASVAANGAVAHAQLEAGHADESSVVLVVGAGGALGSTVAALAAYRGALVIGLDRLGVAPDCLDGLPLSAAIDGEAADLTQQLRRAAGEWGVDCVVDNLGMASVWEAYRPVLADMGSVVVSGALSPAPLPVSLLPFYLRSQSLIGVRTGNRRHVAGIWEDVARGFRPPASHLRRLPWLDVATAHERVETGTAHGQSILEVA